MRTNEQDRQRKRIEASQQNPELDVGDPGDKRKSKRSLAERTTVPSPEESAEGVRRMQNDSKKTSQERNLLILLLQ